MNNEERKVLLDALYDYAKKMKAMRRFPPFIERAELADILYQRYIGEKKNPSNP